MTLEEVKQKFAENPGALINFLVDNNPEDVAKNARKLGYPVMDDPTLLFNLVDNLAESGNWNDVKQILSVKVRQDRDPESHVKELLNI